MVEGDLPSLSTESILALARGQPLTILSTKEAPHLRLVKTNPMFTVEALASMGASKGASVRKHLKMTTSTSFFTLTPILVGETHSGWVVACPNLVREVGFKFISACTKQVLVSVDNTDMLKKAGGVHPSPVGLPDPSIAFMDKDIVVFESEGLASVLIIVDQSDSRI